MQLKLVMLTGSETPCTFWRKVRIWHSSDRARRARRKNARVLQRSRNALVPYPLHLRGFFGLARSGRRVLSVQPLQWTLCGRCLCCLLFLPVRDGRTCIDVHKPFRALLKPCGWGVTYVTILLSSAHLSHEQAGE